MKLDYPQKSNGMLIIKGPDFDDIATMVLSEYQPNALRSPRPSTSIESLKMISKLPQKM